MTSSTRDRLITAAMTLFAERGTHATTIGDIEAAAGLTRRGGAFYKHFTSKTEVLEAGVERHIAQAEAAFDLRDALPLGDLRSELTLLCRVLLSVLDREREVMRVLEKEGEQNPALRDQLVERVLEPGVEQAAAFVSRWVDTSAADIDLVAVATILLGSIVNFRRTAWTFGRIPSAVDEQRFVTTWVDIWTRWFESSPR